METKKSYYNLGVLGYKNIIKDIKELSKFNKWFILVTGVISTLLTFIDFNHFTYPDSSPSVWSIVNVLNTDKVFLGSVPKWLDAFFYSLSGIASFTTIVNIILICNSKLSNYFWGLISGISLGLFSFDFGYTGDAQLNILINIPMQFIGWWLWTKNLDESKNVKVRDNNTYLVSGLSLLICIPIFALLFFEVPWIHKLITNSEYEHLHNYVPRTFDSLTGSISIVASGLMLLRFKEQWLLWIIFNIIQLILFSGINNVGSSEWIINVNSLIQSVFSLVNSIIGSIMWFKKSKLVKKPFINKKLKI